MGVLAKAERRWVIPLTAICFVLGGLLAIQIHSKKQRGATQVGRQTSALIGAFTATQDQLQKQREETERLRARVAQYETEAATETSIVKLMAEDLKNTRVALGLLPVKGPGIELELGDSSLHVKDDIGGQELYVIHDFDLVQVVNELWAAEAEAISIGGQRVVAGSAITCSARLIKVNDVTITPPFVFLAIGDKDKLMSALNIRDGLLDRYRIMRFYVKLTPKDEVTVPAIAIAPTYKYAQPVVKEATP